MVGGDGTVPSMQKVIERILNLLAFLLTVEHPVTADEIRYTVAGYDDKSDEGFRRTFERDKELLRQIGVPLRLEATDQFEVEQGYVVSDYALEDPGLTEDERVALALAAQAVRFGGQPAGPEAVLKLGGALAGDAMVPIGADLGAEAGVVADAFAAVWERRPVTFEYRDRDRTIHPYGLVHRRGHWYLVGPEPGAKIKVYRLDRAGALSIGEPGSFERPEGFRARDAVANLPWDQGEEGLVTTIRFDPEVAWIAERELGAHGSVERGTDGAIDVTLKVGATGPLLGWLIGFEDRAVILAPDTLIDQYVSMMQP
jgi:proteasome accessory factor B